MAALVRKPATPPAPTRPADPVAAGHLGQERVFHGVLEELGHDHASGVATSAATSPRSPCTEITMG